MLRIRLRRVGKKKQPAYRLVVADSRAPRDGAFVETIGTYNPLTHPATITVDEERARHWLSKGAQPSERALKILASRGVAEFDPAAAAERVAAGAEKKTAAAEASAGDAAEETPSAAAESPGPESNEEALVEEAAPEA